MVRLLKYASAGALLAATVNATYVTSSTSSYEEEDECETESYSATSAPYPTATS
ncbi:hypothetical protein F4821DRAFT_222889, partial [Hypoxylon rubiginosum]